ncbi:MAG: hypothetical protein ABJA67_14730 [Chthonomonadales bacterium]
MKFGLRFIAVIALPILISGCGGGHGISDNLGSYAPGSTWTYRVSGSVILPSSAGGGNQGLQSTSSMVMTVTPDVIKDAAGLDTHVMNRRYNLVLLDGRVVKANLRLLITQDNLGVFVHGINESESDTIDSTNTKLVPSTANPPFKFLYLPSPAPAGRNFSYDDPIGIGRSFSFAEHANPRQHVTVPAGDFLAYILDQVEGFSHYTIGGAAFVPEVGIVGGSVTSVLPDGSQLSGNITLLSSSH